MQNEEKKAVNKKAFIGTIVVLLLLNSITLYMLFSEKGEKNVIGTQKTALESQFRSLSDTLDVRSGELEVYRGRTAELDKAITAKQEEIELQKKQIRNMLAKGNLSQAELSKAKKMIAQYETSIAEMTKKIDELSQQNRTLASNNDQLNADLTNEKRSTTTLTEQNKVLGKKVEIGSLLQIAKVDVQAVKKKNNGKEVGVKRAKAAESLKISFETGQNKVLDPGQLSLYVRIINPKGETILVQEQGSGVIEAPEAAEAVPYSKKADFEYDQTNKKVVVYWSQNIQTAGTYKVQVYQAGHVVGEGAVTLS